MRLCYSNLNSSLHFSFELNPGKKRSILSCKHLLYSQFRVYWNPFEQCFEIATVGSISLVPTMGAEALRLRILADQKVGPVYEESQFKLVIRWILASL